jgi:hypothetical protein
MVVYFLPRISLLFVHSAIDPMRIRMSGGGPSGGQVISVYLRTGVCGEVASDDPTSLLKAFKAIRDIREGRAHNRHVQIREEESNEQPLFKKQISRPH